MDAFSQNPAEFFDQQGGIEVGESDKQAGVYVEEIHSSDWIKYAGIDFKKGVKRLKFSAAATTNGWSFDVRSDTKTGKLHGTCMPSKKAKPNSWRTYTCNLEDLSGVKDIFFVFKNDLDSVVRLNWYEYH